MKIKRKVLKAMKSCSKCGKETELLRFRCPHCSSELFMIPPDQELHEEMLGHQKLSHQYVDQGSRLFQQGLFDQAEQEFSKAIEANPWNAAANGNIGVVLLRQGQPKKALKWFERALEIDPKVPGAEEMVQKVRSQLS